MKIPTGTQFNTLQYILFRTVVFNYDIYAFNLKSLLQEINKVGREHLIEKKNNEYKILLVCNYLTIAKNKYNY